MAIPQLKWRTIGYPWKTVVSGEYLVPKQLKPVEIMVNDEKLPSLVRSGQWGGPPSAKQKSPAVKVYVSKAEDGTGTDSAGVATVLVRFPPGNYARTAPWDVWRQKMAAGNMPVAIVSGGMGLNVYGEKLIQTATGFKPPLGGKPPAAAYPIGAPTADPIAPPPPGTGPGPGAGNGVIGQIVGGTTGGIPTWLILVGIAGGIWWWRSRR